MLARTQSIFASDAFAADAPRHAGLAVAVGLFATAALFVKDACKL
jgi:hypothetical protein